jgi:hypothetical protein
MPLANSLSIASAAARHIEAYPSVAADTGEPVRNARHLLNRVLNSTNGAQEVPAQMAAASLLELPSFMCSHAFWFLFARPALAFLQQRQQEEPVPSSASSASNEEESVQLLLDDDPAAAADNEENDNYCPDDADEEPLLADEQPGLPDEGAARIETTIDGTTVLVSQHEHYRWRGQQLAHLNFYEYVGFVSIVKKQAPKQPPVAAGASAAAAGDPEHGGAASDDGNDIRPPHSRATGAGRHQNARFLFDSLHSLAQSHEQQLRSKQLIPFLAGRAPPMFPGRYPQRRSPQPGNNADWQRRIEVWRRKANEFAMFYITILVPWDVETGRPPVPLSYGGLLQWLRQVQAPTASFVDRCRLQLLRNAIHCSTTSSSGWYNTLVMYLHSHLISFFGNNQLGSF